MQARLVEPGVKYFFRESLKQCQTTKFEYYNSLFNLVLCVIFVLVFGTILLMTYRNKQDSYGRKQKLRQQEEYLAMKIHKIKQEKQRERGQMITNIPEFESEQHIQMKKFL